MKQEPHKAQKTEPPTTQPAPQPGPAYDPMDRIVQELQNVQTFLTHLDESPADFNYVNSHLPQILSLRKTIALQLDLLADEPYDYPVSRLNLLKKENERIFSYVEGTVGAMDPSNPRELKRFIRACGQAILKFDGDLTP